MPKSNFDELLSQLAETANEAEALAKSLPAQEQDEDEDDDQNIATATDDSDDETDTNEDDDSDDKDAPMAKSMTAVDADGNEFEAVDATQLLKSLEIGRAHV